MRKKLIASILTVFLVALLYSIRSLAVEYSITNSTIEAYLQENGNVQIIEKHTYEFDGEFNGITRTIIPKQGAGIVNFFAFEGEKELSVYKDAVDEHLYRIYRGGSDETITVELNYTIVNGVEKFSDIAQFYWPFFDDSNSSTYVNLDIYIHPPKETGEVIAYGYDSALGTEHVLSGGVVHFDMGTVHSETNGDIRVAYDASLFPTAKKKSNDNMQDEVLVGLEESKVALDRIKFIGDSAPFILGLIGVIYLFIIIMTRINKKRRKIEARRLFSTDLILPKETLSGPGLALYTSSGLLRSHILSAGLLDLIRKNRVEQESKTKYKLIDRTFEHDHEAFLMEWLFNKLGRNNTFNLAILKQKLKKKSKQKEFNQSFNKWMELVRKEIIENQLEVPRGKFKLGIGILGVLSIPYAIILGINGFTGWMTIDIILIILLLLFALFYQPYTPKGMAIKEEWKQFRKNYQQIEAKMWHSWDDNDKIRALIYGVGLGNKKMKAKNEQLIKAIPNIQMQFPQSSDSYMHLVHLYASSNAIDSQFTAANNMSTGGSSSGGSSSGGGSGTGGGGGGSGAF